MKYLFPFLFSLLLFCNRSQAQETGLTVGFVAGPSRVSLYGNSLLHKNDGAAVRPVAGVTAEYQATPHFSLVTQLAYESKGSNLEGNFTDVTGSSTYPFKSRDYFDYITLPVLFRFSMGSKIRYFLNAGPYAGFLLRQHSRVSSEVYSSRSDQTELFKRIDAGLSAGLGISAPLNTSTMLSVELRNNLGLKNISKAPVIGDGVISTNSLNLLLGVSFRPWAKDTEKEIAQ